VNEIQAQLFDPPPPYVVQSLTSIEAVKSMVGNALNLRELVYALLP